jgi:hypothetical protein
MSETHLWRIVPTVYENLNSNNGLSVPVGPFSSFAMERNSHSLILFSFIISFLISALLLKYLRKCFCQKDGSCIFPTVKRDRSPML